MKMAEKKTKNDELKKMTYQELEKEADGILEALSQEDVSLDNASKIYEYGKKVYAEMEARLAELEKNVSDTISRE